jgi:rod shape-determining protein MreD
MTMGSFGRSFARSAAADRPALRALRCAVVVVAVVIVQISLLSRITIVGVHPDLVVLLAVAAGITGGAELGAVIGFSAGLLFDLMLPGPAGISALSFSIVGYAVGSLQSSVMRASWWIPVVSALVATAAGETLYAVIRQVLGQPIPSWGHVPTVVALVAIVDAVLAYPFLRIAAWMADGRVRRGSPYSVR